MNRRERRVQWQASNRITSGAAVSSIACTPALACPVISMRIGELILRGFEKRHASRIAAAFERSLDNHLRTGVPPAPLAHGMQSPSLRLAPLTLTRPSDPVAIGEQLAGSVFAFKLDGRRGGLW
ncbi:MAG TPA: hypothetical protein VN734_10345 [Acidobacteriaceae bacterium]|nr:hypothetical protein [Acidobacteriaceae bacterium]